MMKTRGLYLHYNGDSPEEFSLLKKEIQQIKNKPPIDTIFFGGSFCSLEIFKLRELSNLLEETFSLNLKEKGIEVSPLELESQKISLLEDLNFSRISLKTKTFSPRILEELQEDYTKEELIKILEELKNSKIKNISLDFYIGLPFQEKKDILEDLREIKRLNIPALSLYEWNDTEDSKENWLFMARELEKLGFQQEEWLSFYKEPFRNEYHLKYWTGEEYLGYGLGAVSFTGIYEKNTENLEEYKRLLELERPPIVEVEKDRDFLIFYEINMAFRLLQGVSLKRLKRKYDYHLMERNKDFLEDLKDRKLIKISKDYVSLTKEGFFLTDYILSKLIFY